MQDLGYTAEQAARIAECMNILREWFDNSIVIVKDSRKVVYWETDADTDLLYPMLKIVHDEAVDGGDDDECEMDFAPEEWKDPELWDDDDGD